MGTLKEELEKQNLVVKHCNFIFEVKLVDGKEQGKIIPFKFSRYLLIFKFSDRKYSISDCIKF